MVGLEKKAKQRLRSRLSRCVRISDNVTVVRAVRSEFGF